MSTKASYLFGLLFFACMTPGLTFGSVLQVDSGGHSVVGNESYGVGTPADAVVVNGGTLTIETGATLTVGGHLSLLGADAKVVVRDGASILFSPTSGQTYEVRFNAEGQTVEFAGTEASRGRIGKAPGAAGSYYFHSVGSKRDTSFSGSYGLIEDANNPSSGMAWAMFMQNVAGRSNYDASHIEFRRSGTVRIDGYDAGNATNVNLHHLTFRDSLTSPTFWFDGFADNNTTASRTATNKSITHVVADKEIWLRFVTGYKLDHFVIDSDNGGGIRTNAPAGMAQSHNFVFIASRKGGSALNLIADETDHSYLFIEADNPHGWSTQALTGDALLSNYWYESNWDNSSDTGDAVVTNGVPVFSTDLPHRVTIRDCGVIGNTSSASGASDMTLVSYNDATGREFEIDHCVAKVNPNSQAIAFDEGADTPAGSGVSVTNSVFYSDPSDPNTFAIGSARDALTQVVESNPVALVDKNLYGNLANGSNNAHAANFTISIDQQSKFETPVFFDSSRSLATWDASLNGGSGSAAHATAELMKLNDADHNDSYTVENLITYMRTGFTVFNAGAVNTTGQPWGPSLVGLTPPPAGGGGDGGGDGGDGNAVAWTVSTGTVEGDDASGGFATTQDPSTATYASLIGPAAVSDGVTTLRITTPGNVGCDPDIGFSCSVLVGFAFGEAAPTSGTDFDYYFSLTSSGSVEARTRSSYLNERPYNSGDKFEIRVDTNGDVTFWRLATASGEPEVKFAETAFVPSSGEPLRAAGYVNGVGGLLAASILGGSSGDGGGDGGGSGGGGTGGGDGGGSDPSDPPPSVVASQPGVPTAPTPNTTGSFTLNWASSTGEVDHYELQRSVNTLAWIDLGDITTNSYADSGLGTASFRYRVRAVNAAGESDWSPEGVVIVDLTAPPPPPPTGAPGTPPSLNLATSSNQLSTPIAWGTASGQVDLYRLERSTGSGWTSIYSGVARVHQDSLPAFGDYSYRVQACNANGCSSFSATASISISPASLPIYTINSPSPPDTTQSGNFEAAALVGDEIGATSGQFSVGNSGDSSYLVRIQTAQGVAGLEPNMAISYGSSGGNGAVGLGGEIVGLSKITRCRQTLHQDHLQLPISWGKDDRFCLEGQRLVVVAGVYGAPGSEYRTEIDSYRVITAIGGSLGSPSEFKVEHRDGRVYHYGESTNSLRTSINGEVLSWSVSTIEDAAGNEMFFDYLASHPGELIELVGYAGGSRNATSASILFSYEDRPDVLRRYVGGSLFSIDQRLKQVQSLNGQAEVRSFLLKYNEASASNAHDSISRLTSIEECVDSACLPKTRFTWDLPEVGFSTVAGTTMVMSGPQSNESDFIPADINGDGLLDMVWASFEDHSGGTSSVRYALNQGQSFAATTFVNANGSSGPLHIPIVDGHTETKHFDLVDVNGDGRTDLRTSAGIHLSVPTTLGWRLSATRISSPCELHQPFPNVIKYRQVVDLNRDGLQDLTCLEDGMLNGYLLRPSSRAASSSRYYDYGPAIPLVRIAPPGPQSGLNLDPNDSVVFGDFRGSGSTDLMVVKPAYFIIYRLDTNAADATVSVTEHYRSSFGGALTGSMFVIDTYEGGATSTSPIVDDETGAFFDIIGPNGNPWFGGGYHNLEAKDINADGLTDIVFYWQGNVFNPSRLAIAFSRAAYRLNTGDGFSQVKMLRPEVGFAHWGVGFFDYNRDGFYDYVDQSGIRLWNSQSNGFAKLEDAIVDNSVPNKTRLGDGLSPNGLRNKLIYDLNGDGTVDLLQRDFIRAANGAEETAERGMIKVYSGNRNGAENRVTKITDGLGAVVEVDYEPLASSSHYDRPAVVEAPTESCVYDSLLMDCWDGQTAVEPSAYYQHLNDPLAELPAHAESLGSTTPTIELLSASQIVTEVRVSNPILSNPDNLLSTSYHYYDMHAQAAGRGALGFRSLTKIDSQTGLVSQKWLRQDWPFTGVTEREEERSSDGMLLKRKTFDWTINHWSSSLPEDAKNMGTAKAAKNVWRSDLGISQGSEGAYQLYPIGQVEEDFRLVNNGSSQGERIKLLETATLIDNYGIPFTQTKLYRDGQANTLLTESTINVPTTQTFSGRPGDWGKRRGLIERTTVSSSLTRPDGTSDQTARTTDYTYYTSGSSIGLVNEEIVEPDGEATGINAEVLSTFFTYDSYGNPTSRELTGWGGQGSQSRKVEIAYDPIGRYMLHEVNPVGLQDATVESRDERGNISLLEDMNGIQTAKGFTPFSNEYFTGSETGSYTASYRVSDLNRCPSISSYKRVILKGGYPTREECFDKIGRAIRELEVGFSGQWIATETSFDDEGRVTRQSEPYYLNSESPQWKTLEYDLIGRVVKVTLADGTVAETKHSGLTVVETNARGMTTSTTRDVLDNVVVVETNQNNSVVDATVTFADRSKSEYLYDSRNNLEKVTHVVQPGDTVRDDVSTLFVYDRLDRRRSVLDPDKGLVTFDYNAFGEPVKVRNPRGQVTTQVYDQLGRKVRRTDSSSDTYWTFDTEEKGKGQLARTFDSRSNFEETYTYDNLARSSLVTTTLPFNYGTYYRSTTYDTFNRIFQQFDIDNATMVNDGTRQGVETLYNQYGHAYLYEDVRRLSGGASVSSYREVIARNSRGSVTRERRGNAADLVRAYDVQTDRMCYIGTRKLGDTVGVTGCPAVGSNDSGSLDIQDLYYEWDDVGNLESRGEYSADKSLDEQFTYDASNRLTTYEVIGNPIRTIDYDSLGNIRTKDGLTYSYGSDRNGGPVRPHAVSKIGAADLNYDENGNLFADYTAGSYRRLNYYSFEKLSSVEFNGHRTEYAYGPDRSRYYRGDIHNGDLTRRLYIGTNEIIQYGDSGRTELKRKVPGAVVTQYFDSNQTSPSNESIAHLFYDHLGSLDVITDELGNVVSEQSFDAWGQRRDAQTWGQSTRSEAAIVCNRIDLLGISSDCPREGYTGHDMLDEVGLVHMGGRVYDPYSARFVQADPMVPKLDLTASWNRYSYVLNNPLNKIDPTGYIEVELEKLKLVEVEYTVDLETGDFVAVGTYEYSDGKSAGQKVIAQGTGVLSGGTFQPEGGSNTEVGVSIPLPGTADDDSSDGRRTGIASAGDPLTNNLLADLGRALGRTERVVKNHNFVEIKKSTKKKRGRGKGTSVEGSLGKVKIDTETGEVIVSGPSMSLKIPLPKGFRGKLKLGDDGLSADLGMEIKGELRGGKQPLKGGVSGTVDNSLKGTFKIEACHGAICTGNETTVDPTVIPSNAASFFPALIKSVLDAWQDATVGRAY